MARRNNLEFSAILEKLEELHNEECNEETRPRIIVELSIEDLPEERPTKNDKGPIDIGNELVVDFTIN